VYEMPTLRDKKRAGDNARRTWVRKYEGSQSEQERLQNSLRQDPQVAKVLDLWWRTAARSAKRQYITHDEYVAVSRKMYKALYSVWDAEDAEAAAEEDWSRDSRDGKTLSELLFKDAIFELADVWTYAPKVDIYTNFLTDLFHHISLGEPPDSYFWKEDWEIEYGGFQTGAEPSMNRAVFKEAPEALLAISPEKERVPTKLPALAAASPGSPAPAANTKRAVEAREAPKPSPRKFNEPSPPPKPDPGFGAWKRMIGASSLTAARRKSTVAPLPPAAMANLAALLSKGGESRDGAKPACTPRGHLSSRSGVGGAGGIMCTPRESVGLAARGGAAAGGAAGGIGATTPRGLGDVPAAPLGSARGLGKVKPIIRPNACAPTPDSMIPFRAPTC